MDWNDELKEYLNNIDEEVQCSLPKIKAASKRDQFNMKSILESTMRRIEKSVDEFEDKLNRRSDDRASRKRRRDSDVRDKSNTYKRERSSRKERSRSPRYSRRSASKSRRSASDEKRRPNSNKLSENDSGVFSIDKHALVKDWLEQRPPSNSNKFTRGRSQHSDEHGQSNCPPETVRKATQLKLPAGMSFVCFHCRPEDASKNRRYTHFKDVYAHWLTDHMGTKPFQFMVIEHMACFFCDSYGSRKEMFEHQAQSHPEQPKVIATGTGGLCAVCNYNGNDLMEHFKKQHSSLKLEQFKATVLDNDTLNGLLLLDQRRLGDPNQATVSKNLTACDRIDYLICGCESKIGPEEMYTNHILSHEFDFDCSDCKFETHDLIELIKHDRSSHGIISSGIRYSQFAKGMKELYFDTKMCFTNGLVVDMRKLAKTVYDISQKFDELVELMVAKIKEKSNQSMEIQPKVERVGIANGRATKRSELNDTESSSSAEPGQNGLDERMSELQKQNEILNHIFVHGIPYRDGEDLHALILKICKVIRADVIAKDINKIYRPSKQKPIIIAVFVDHKTQLEVLKRFSIVTKISKMCLEEVIQASHPEGKIPVLIDWYTTPYFQKLMKAARTAQNNHTLHSYQWTKHGLFVCRRRSSKGKHVLSTGELLAYIKD